MTKRLSPVTIILGNDGLIKDVDFVQWIMNEILDPAFTRRDVARTYAILISKGHREFKGINGAIVERWSMSGLQWIKKQAWKELR